jgi:branched-subunit amino acid transport protein
VNIWLTMLLAGLVTFLIRLSFIRIIGHRSIPPLLQRALRLVPPAVLTAIIFPEVFLTSGQLDLSFGNARLLAGLLATLVAWRTRNALLTIVVGMLSVWLFTWLLH